jgi:hypothetical protein
MWSITVGDVPNDVERAWIPGRSEADHLVMVYELSYPVSVPGVNSILGVASPFPVDTASILRQIRDSLEEIGLGLITELRTDLDSLGHLESARIQSVRVDRPGGYRLDQFSDPISPSELTSPRYAGRLSAVTALLYHTDPPTVVNLFNDNQFYVADPTPESIGEVATRISPLWGPSNVEML